MFTNFVLTDIDECDCQLIFKPFIVDQVNDNKFLLNESDLDPDINLCNSYALPDSVYVTDTDLNDVRSNTDHSNCISILHVNCRSIQKN